MPPLMAAEVVGEYRRPGLNGATSHRFGPRLPHRFLRRRPAPLYDPREGDTPLRIPSARWFLSFVRLQVSSQSGAGDWNRTSNLRFTNKLNGMAQVIDDLGHLPSPAAQCVTDHFHRLVSSCQRLPQFVALPNTVITPHRGRLAMVWEGGGQVMAWRRRMLPAQNN